MVSLLGHEGGRLADRLLAELRRIIETTPAPEQVKRDFYERSARGSLIRGENSENHFCVYFAAYDPFLSDVFIGHHKKADLWLFTGGHIDEGEIPAETVEREIQEEWGYRPNGLSIAQPSFLSITEINNLTQQACRRHYDNWYFLPLRREAFAPDEQCLKTEFYEARWMSIANARSLIMDVSTVQALDVLGEKQ